MLLEFCGACELSHGNIRLPRSCPAELIAEIWNAKVKDARVNSSPYTRSTRYDTHWHSQHASLPPCSNARPPYSLYNDLNDIDEFDVDCRQSDWAGTHIRQHMCWPQFFTGMTAQNAQDWRFGLNILIPVDQLKTKYEDKFDAARANIRRVAEEHPEAREALLEVGKLQPAAKRKREECLAQPAFLGVFRLCKS